jgi:glycosyltransferase involved in cell wall biosynthesis
MSVAKPVARLRACIGLCVYKNAKSLPAVFRNIQAIRPLFRRLQVIVAYDESPDHTETVLKGLQAEYGELDCDLHKNTTLQSSVRTERICHARNTILDVIHRIYPDFDYFMMMDANEYSCIGPIQPTVLSAALAREDWDALSFDREAGYYDYWALSYDPFVYSCYHFDRPYVLRKDWERRLKEAREKAPGELVEVYSAFNGFAIYRMRPFIDCSYSWKIDMCYFPVEVIIKQSFVLDANIVEHLTDDCEHRKFHMQAIKEHGARVRVCLDSLFLKIAGDTSGLRGPA